jgi:transcriptional regulator with XRE-family HTH domain
MPLSSAIGELLRSLRTRAGLTQEALASRAGVSVRTVSDIECGKQMRPRAVTLRSLGEALGLEDHDGQPLLDARSEGSPLSATLPPLVGRESDICFVSTLLAEQRLVTVTGPPGVGKSALARHVLVRAGGAAVVSVYVDLVDAAPGEVAPAIARALGVARLEDPIATRFVLLLDNVECAFDAAHAVAAIVAAAPAGRVLVTSRRRLHVRGEHAFVLAPLTPRDEAQLLRERAVACGARLGPTTISSRSRNGSTVYRLRSSWSRRSCASSRRARCRRGSTISRCSTALRPTHTRASERCATRFARASICSACPSGVCWHGWRRFRPRSRSARRTRWPRRASRSSRRSAR